MAYTIRHQPNQFKSETEKNKLWYKENIQYIMSHFNKRNDRTNRIRKIEDIENPVDEIVRMFTYYLGRQYNKDYYYTTQDQNNCDLPTVWINGQKITSLIDYMVGNVITLIENLEPTTKMTSKTVEDKKKMLLELSLIKLEFQEFFQAIEEETGMAFNPMKMPDNVQVPEDLIRFMEYDYKEQGEVIATKIVEDILNRNAYQDKYKQAFLYLLLGGYVGIHNRIENGKTYFDVILPHNLILDRGKDDDFLSESRFIGVVDYMTTGDIVERYKDFLTTEEITEIKNITTNNLYQLLDLTTHPYSTSWAFTYNSVPMLAVVTGYWVGMKDMKFEQSKDKFGNTHYSRPRKNKKGEFWTKTIHKGILIGNKYIVDIGEESNIVRKNDNPGDVEMPIKVFMPNMVLGENRSVVSRLHQHQDRIDYITNEITKMMNRAKGKVYIINRQKLGTATAKDVITDFERMGIHVTDGSATGEDFVAGQDSRMVEVVDMTLDPNVNQLINLRREEERIMEEIVNIPKIALGQQSGYVGAKTQAGTIAQSNLGTAYLYQGFIRFIEKQLAHALNQFKISILATEEKDIPLGLISSRGKSYVNLTKEFSFEDLGVYIKIKDFIDEQARERLLMQAQAAMQNQMIDMIDYIKIEKAKTYTETLKELEYSLGRKQRQMEALRREQQQMQMMQQQQQLAAQQEIAAMREENANYRQDRQFENQTPNQQQQIEQQM